MSKNDKKAFVRNVDMDSLDAEAYDYAGGQKHFYPIPKFKAISHVKTVKKWVYDEHVHNDHEWILIRNGSIKYQIDDKNYVARKGDFYFVQPGQKHQEISVSGNLDFYVVKFHLINHRGKDAFFLPPPFSAERQKISGISRQLSPLYLKIFREIKDQKPWCEEVIESIIWQMTWIVRRRLNKYLPSPDLRRMSFSQEQIVDSAKTYIEENLSRNISLDELAEACFVSKFYLVHVFKKVTNMSPIRFSLNQRMNEAKKMLGERGTLVKQVATQLGFNDPYYFSRIFKQITGVSPKNYQDGLEQDQGN